MKTLAIISLFAILPLFSEGQGQWGWIKGDTSVNDIVGVLGVPSPSNVAATRYASNGWTDSNGNLWLYAGQHPGNPYHEKDMWRYTVQTNQWDLMYDANTTFSAPVFGPQGIPAPNVHPGSLNFGSPHWTDNDNNLWAMTTFTGDLFKYDVTLHQWAWMNGPGTGVTMVPPTYGIQGVPSDTVTPGEIIYGGEVNIDWTDGAGDFWLFHQGFGTVWKYSPSINQWTWINGANAPQGSVPPFYTSMGVFDALNTPGNYDCGFRAVATWQDSDDHFWVMLNRQNPNKIEIWEYDSMLNLWACHLDESNVYSNAVQCQASSFARPKIIELEQRAVWVDDCDNAYLFCFDSIDSSQLWRYNPAASQFTLINSYNSNAFGSQGVPHSSNHPVLTKGPIAWTANNEFWYQGGSLNGNSVLWKYIPDSVIADFSAVFDTSLCSMVFTDQSYTGCNEVKSWMWDFGDGTTSIDQNPNHTYASAGNYTVSLIIENCSWNSDTLIQQIDVLIGCPIELSTHDDTLCKGDCIYLDFETNVPAETVLVDGVPQANTSQIEVCPMQTTNYLITAISSNGTSDEEIVTITVLDPPSLSVDNNQTLCPPESSILMAEADTSFTFLWSNGSTSYSTSVADTGFYWVVVNDGQCESTASISVTSYCSTDIEMPNVFTPSNNGINDVFLPIYYEGIETYSLTIYNRWGNQVFSTEDINQGWNGNHNDAQCPDGVYFWIVQYSDLSNVEYRIQGSVTLIR